MILRRSVFAAPLVAALPPSRARAAQSGMASGMAPGAVSAAAPSGPVIPGAASAGYHWAIHREGRRIGMHDVSFSERDGIRTVRSEVEIVVRLAGFTVFRYRHDYSESWDGTRLVGFRSMSERQGSVVQLAVRSEGGALLAESGAGRARLPREAAPLSWWDPVVLTRPLFDTTTGAAVDPRPVHDRVATGDRWRLPTAPNAEAVYDGNGQWVAFSSLGEDGVTARYERA